MPEFAIQLVFTCRSQSPDGVNQQRDYLPLNEMAGDNAYLSMHTGVQSPVDNVFEVINCLHIEIHKILCVFFMGMEYHDFFVTVMLLCLW